MPDPSDNLLRWMVGQLRVPRLRTMREFAEQEIVIPSGPFEGRRYSVARNPYAGLWFDAVDSGRWRRLVATGPQQSGKTLQAFVIPLLYHLFEIGETAICGLPTMDMAGDKWAEDILPAIAASRYRDLLPSSGGGSKGGSSNLTRVYFRNGATLAFMSGGGDDKSRAGFTSRVVVITETDGMDQSGGSSREADKITQLEGRTRAFGDRARIYMECTVSIEEGRTWQEYTNGTQSRICCRCPHCRRHVTPEREHLIGWQGADDELQAGERSHFTCPECGATWSEDDRRQANADAILLHRGQEITPEGGVVGTLPRTNTLGFRWTATNNLLVPAGVLGADEWKASRATDEENAEKAQRQFVWALPHKPATVDLAAVNAFAIVRRKTTDVRGRVPSDATRVTVGIDLGKYLCHWTAVAWRPHASPHVIEYGRLEVPSNEMGEEQALLMALRQFRDETAKRGWPGDAGIITPGLVFIDSGWHPDVVDAFCRESGKLCFPAKGFGERQVSAGGRRVGERKATGTTVVGVADGYEVVTRPGNPVPLVDINADRWKSWLLARLQTPVDKPGAMTLHNVDSANDHLTFAKHLTAEKKVEEFMAGKGVVTRWERVNRNNHYLDSTCLACVAGHAAGERLMGEEKPAEARAAATTHDASTSLYRPRRW